MTLQVGDKAPDFTLPDQSGTGVTLSERLREKVVVLYFYPKDNTRGCTAEACSFRDGYESFSDAGAEVIGVSSDTVESHEKFAGRHELPFLCSPTATARSASSTAPRRSASSPAGSPSSSTRTAPSGTPSRR